VTELVVAVRFHQFPAGTSMPFWSGPDEGALSGAVERDASQFRAMQQLRLVGPDGQFFGTLGDFLSNVLGMQGVAYGVKTLPYAESTLITPVNAVGGLVGPNGRRLS
jgi:hypothetical protein